jgi:hypothetical protein
VRQAYFAELLEKGYLEDCNPSRGRFRAFQFPERTARATNHPS